MLPRIPLGSLCCTTRLTSLRETETDLIAHHPEDILPLVARYVLSHPLSDSPSFPPFVWPLHRTRRYYSIHDMPAFFFPVEFLD